MPKSAVLHLKVFGLKTKPSCTVKFMVNPVGSKRLYEVTSIAGTITGSEFNLKQTLELNPDMDQLLADYRHGGYRKHQ